MDLAGDSYYMKHKRILYSQEDQLSGRSPSHTRVLLPYFSKAGHMLYFKTDLGGHSSPDRRALAASSGFSLTPLDWKPYLRPWSDEQAPSAEHS